jgi:hypothetical protein
MSPSATLQSTTLKTIASVLSGLLLAVGLLWSGPAVAQDGPTVSIQSQQAEAGQAVDVPVTVTEFDSIGAVDLVVNYDPNVLSLSDTEGLIEGAPEDDFSANVSEPGELRINWFDSTGENPITLGDGTLLTITFSEFAGGTSDVTFGDASELADETATTIDATFEDGIVSGELSTLSAGSVSEVGLNQTVSVPLSADSLQNVGSASIKLAYDDAALQFEGIANDSSGLDLQADASGGVVTLGGFNTNGTTLTEGFVQVQFTFLGGSSDLNILSDTEISDVSGNRIQTALDDGLVSGDAPTLSFADVNVQAGDTASVAVQASDLQALGAASVDVTFSAASLTFVGTSEPIVDGLQAGNEETGVGSLGFFSTDGVDPADNDGKLVNLRFAVAQEFNPGSQTTLGFNAAESELSNPDGDVYNTAFASGTVTSVPQEISVDVTRDFGDASDPANYELVALPGAADVDVAETVSGEQGPNWRVFRELGATNDGDAGLQEYDGSEAFNFRAGRAFWVISQNPLSFQGTVSPTTESSISLQGGWNAVSNPLQSDLDWQSVQNANGLDEALWRWDGGWEQVDTFSSATTGEGYYVFNSAGLNALSLTSGASRNSVAAKKTSSQTIELTARAGEEDGSSVTVGIGSEKSTYHAPPAHFASSKTTLRVLGTDSDTKYARLVKPVEGESTTFRLVLNGQKNVTATIEASELNASGPEGAVLIDESSDRTYDLRETSTVSIPTGDDGTVPLSLQVGPADEIRQIAAPEKTQLQGNYPNPFSQQTTVEIALSEQADVEVQVYNVLGQQVATVADGQMEAGNHKLEWEGSSLSSGVYFVRMKAGDVTDTHKITVVR